MFKTLSFYLHLIELLLNLLLSFDKSTKFFSVETIFIINVPATSVFCGGAVKKYLS